jgi:endonuclease I
MRLFTLLLVFFALRILAQIPAGYYDSAANKTGDELRTALFDIIKDHNVESYSDLWDDFEYTDKKSNGKVWDMYSDVPGGTPPYQYTFGSDQCGTYDDEGVCYNREHSFPKSWFNDDYPMYTDLFHLYPTDGYVNGRRSNYPYGEVGSASWTSLNGSKLGDCSYPGYSGTVFEPIDEYKGDFARSYFYMLTCYKDQISSWSSPMLSGSDFAYWAKNLLLDWAEQDPVSQKEIDRNEEVYNIQNNRNPFIDHPEYACLIWGSNCSSGVNNIDNVDFYVFPNPAKNTISIDYHSYTDATSKICIFNNVGEEVLHSIITNGSNKIDIASLPKGVYILSLTNDKIKLNKKIVKE